VATPVNWKTGEEVVIAGSSRTRNAKKQYRKAGKRRSRTADRAAAALTAPSGMQ